MSNEELPRGAQMVMSLMEAMASPTGEMAELIRAHLQHVEEEHREEVAAIAATALVIDIGIAMLAQVKQATVLTSFLTASGATAKHLLASLAGQDEAAFGVMAKDISGYLRDNGARIFGADATPTEATYAGSESVH